MELIIAPCHPNGFTLQSESELEAARCVPDNLHCRRTCRRIHGRHAVHAAALAIGVGAGIELAGHSGPSDWVMLVFFGFFAALIEALLLFFSRRNRRAVSKT